jgi:CelD/BcsL family acetyltransferase involved in cellulose biosynthesis
MKIRLVKSLREFDRLAPVWQDVVTAGGQTSPFLSHDWFACCWRTAGPDRRRELWVVEDTCGPLALIPLTRWRSHRWGAPVRMLSFLESPDTPFADIPMAQPSEEVMRTFLDALRARAGWDVFSIRKMPVESSTLKVLETALSDGFPWREDGRHASPYVAISGNWEEFIRHKSQRFRKTLRYVENRLQKHGAVTVEEHRDVDPSGPIFAEVMAVSQQSWKGPRGLAMATMEGMPRFFREFTHRASANGWLHLWILRLAGRAVATEYQIGAGGSLHALRADFDATLAALSPGASLNLRILQLLFDRGGFADYDMGPGQNPYKLRWATGTHEAVTLDVYAPSPYGRLLHRIETRAVPLLRRLKHRVRQLCA